MRTFAAIRVTLLAASLAAPASAAPGDLLQAFANPTPADRDFFGTSVVGVGLNNVLIGAPHDNGEPGAAYLFNGLTGDIMLTLERPEPDGLDWFGQSVAVSGDAIVVGAPAQNIYSGAVHTFDRSTGEHLHTLTSPSPGSGKEFGQKIAAVGGKVAIAEWINGQQRLDRVIHVFDSETGEYIRGFGRPAGDTGVFAESLAPMGDQLLVGSRKGLTGSTPGFAHVFDIEEGDVLQSFPNPTPIDPGGFGAAVAAVGSNVLVGAWLSDLGGGSQTGAAFLFDGSTGELLETIENPTPSPGDHFGFDVAAVGGNVLIGAPLACSGRGDAYLFDTDGNLLEEYLCIGGRGGKAVAGVYNKVLIGSPDNIGAAWLYEGVDPPFLLGDMDIDSDTDFDDIDDFVLALFNASDYVSQYGVPPELHGDIDRSGNQDFDDISGFIDILNAPPLTGVQRVPEPSAVVLGVLALLAYGAAARRRLLRG